MSGNNNKSHERHCYNIIFLFLVGLNPIAFSQDSSTVTKSPLYRIGLFAPLYLDSAFDQNAEYRYPRITFPKYIIPGLELVEGALLAMDSLNKLKVPIELVIQDTRSDKENLRKQLDNTSAQNLDLIITHCTTSELQTLAAFGYEKKYSYHQCELTKQCGYYEQSVFGFTQLDLTNTMFFH